MKTLSDIPLRLRMAADAGDDSLYPIAVLIDELRNEDVQVIILDEIIIIIILIIILVIIIIPVLIGELRNEDVQVI